MWNRSPNFLMKLMSFSAKIELEKLELPAAGRGKQIMNVMTCVLPFESSIVHAIGLFSIVDSQLCFLSPIVILMSNWKQRKQKGDEHITWPGMPKNFTQSVSDDRRLCISRWEKKHKPADHVTPTAQKQQNPFATIVASLFFCSEQKRTHHHPLW